MLYAWCDAWERTSTSDGLIGKICWIIPLDDILCTIDPPEPCGQFYRGSPMLSFSRDVLKKVEVELLGKR